MSIWGEDARPSASMSALSWSCCSRLDISVRERSPACTERCPRPGERDRKKICQRVQGMSRVPYPYKIYSIELHAVYLKGTERIAIWQLSH